jgi:hypothetical protein
MKKLFVLLAVTVILSDSCAQGTVNFNNRVPAFGLDAPISVGNVQTGPGPTWSAALFHNGLLIPGSVTTFRDGTSNPQFAKYIEGITVTVPGTEPGQQDFAVEMRVWQTVFGSYDAAPSLLRGTSGDLIIATLGGGTDPTANNNLPSYFTGFLIWPEPSPLALGILGGIVLLLGRRRKSEVHVIDS